MFIGVPFFFRRGFFWKIGYVEETSWRGFHPIGIAVAHQEIFNIRRRQMMILILFSIALHHIRSLLRGGVETT